MTFSALSANSGSVTSTVTATVTGASASSNATSSATPTTAYTPSAPTDVLLLSLNCQNDTIQESTFHKGTFQQYCGIDFGSGAISTTKDSNGKALVYVDLLGIIEYTLSDCLQACLNMNVNNDLYNRDSSMYCRSILFNSQLRNSVQNVGANCWIKNGTPADINPISFPVDLSDTYLSASLISS